MTGMASHEFGCACASHVGRSWHRPEHWTRKEVAYLEVSFGRHSDQAIARHLHRTVLGVRLKAKRLGLHKRDAGYTASAVGVLLAVDATTVSKVWIRKGLLKARLGWYQGPTRVRLISEASVEAFIRQHGQWLDAERVPADSPFKALAMANRWTSLTELTQQTGHGRKYLLWFLKGGVITSARKGTHWYVRADEAWKLTRRSPDAIDYARFIRAEMLQRRNDRRKGVAA